MLIFPPRLQVTPSDAVTANLAVVGKYVINAFEDLDLLLIASRNRMSGFVFDAKITFNGCPVRADCVETTLNIG